MNNGVASTPMQHDHGNHQRQKCTDRAGHAPRLLLVPLRQQPRIHRNERGREYALAEEVLQEVGDAERRAERVGRRLDPK